MLTARWAFNTRQWLNSPENWRLCLASIQPEEVKRLSEFVYSNSAVSSMFGRLLLRRWATTFLNLPASDVLFTRSEKGRPQLVWPKSMEPQYVDVNVSHQGDWVVLSACENGKVGVDVMKVEYAGGKSTSEFFRLMTRQFTTQEWKEITSSEEEWAQLSSFYRHWCLKESFVKALGVGIGYDLQKISFKMSSPLSGVDSLVYDTTVCTGSADDGKWLFEETKLDEKHSCAIAYLPSGSSHVHLRADDVPISFQKFTLTDFLSDLPQLHSVSDELVQKFVEKEMASWL